LAKDVASHLDNEADMTTYSHLIVVLWTTCAVWALPTLSFAATPEPTAEQVKFFEEKVRPILADNCYKCHGSEKQKGSLRLHFFV